ncbi:MAG: DoxX family protein [Labilithrix sp.]|nr:DoxX family protein [Labilithrix sp.]
MSMTTLGEAQTHDTGSDRQRRALDLGLLLLRVGAAALIWNFHMARKLVSFSEELHSFPDPLGIGHAPSFAMALGSEGLCSILVAFGIATRLLSLPIIFTMLMVLVLGARGFEGADVQSALLYALPYTALVLTGAGRWSVDWVLRARWDCLIDRLVKAGARAKS